MRASLGSCVSSSRRCPALVLDSKTLRLAHRDDRDPFDGKSIVIMSYPFASRMRDDIKRIAWDLVIMPDDTTPMKPQP